MFLTCFGLAQCKERDVLAVKNGPPSVFCKQVWKTTHYPDKEQMQNISISTFGVPDKTETITKWFAQRRTKEFSTQEAHVKHQCTSVVKPRALQQVERSIQCAQAWCLTKGQCTAKNLQHIPGQVGLKVSGSKPELVEHCYNNLVSLHRCFGVPEQLDSDAHVEPKMPNDILGEDNDELCCAVCDSDEVQEGNAMLLCDGDHEQEVGYHQQCLPPPLLRYHRGIGFAQIGTKNNKNHPDATRK